MRRGGKASNKGMCEWQAALLRQDERAGGVEIVRRYACNLVQSLYHELCVSVRKSFITYLQTISLSRQTLSTNSADAGSCHEMRERASLPLKHLCLASLSEVRTCAKERSVSGLNSSSEAETGAACIMCVPRTRLLTLPITLPCLPCCCTWIAPSPTHLFHILEVWHSNQVIV
jgi:hypothetical protein